MVSFILSISEEILNFIREAGGFKTNNVVYADTDSHYTKKNIGRNWIEWG